MSDIVEEKLNPKQKAFIAAYLGDAHFNGTEAARLAGYKGNGNTLGVTAYHLLRNPKIKEQIDASLEAITMPASAVLKKLTDIASGSIEDFLDEDEKFDFAAARKKGKMPLVKKLKRKSTSKRIDTQTEEFEGDSQTLETSLLFEEIEFELYSAHEALRDLGKYHKLFTDRLEHQNPDGSALAQPVADAISSFEKNLLKIYGPTDSTN